MRTINEGVITRSLSRKRRLPPTDRVVSASTGVPGTQRPADESRVCTPIRPQALPAILHGESMVRQRGHVSMEDTGDELRSLHRAPQAFKRLRLNHHATRLSGMPA